MREYAKVAPQFWTGLTGKKIRAMGPEVQVVALYLLTCPSSRMIGLYYLPLPVLCHEVGCPIEGASKALSVLESAGFAYYDTEQELVWVPEMARFQISEGLHPRDKRIIGIEKELELFRKSRFLKEFRDRYGKAFHLNQGSPFEAPSKPHRSKEKEKEQEKESLSVPSGGTVLELVPRKPRKAQVAISYPDEFEICWQAYPNHSRTTKHKSFLAWQKVQDPQPTPQAVLDSIETWKRSRQWQKDKGEFIPGMGPWLNNRAWETQPEPANANHARIDPQSAAIAARLEARGKPPQ
jgi:hypothetical protein